MNQGRAQLRRMCGLASSVRVINFPHYKMLSRLTINSRKASGAATIQTQNPTIIQTKTLRPCLHPGNSKRRSALAHEIMRRSLMVRSIVISSMDIS
jgi:hypothetical protein